MSEKIETKTMETIKQKKKDIVANYPFPDNVGLALFITMMLCFVWGIILGINLI